MPMKRMLLLTLLAAVLAPSVLAAPKVTTVIMVRHAEKASPDGDPPLSVAGVERSKELARVLTGVPVRAIYITQYIRTQMTAQPFAEAVAIKPVVRATGKSYAADLTKEILADHAGETVLVVGHTTTTAEMLRAFGVKDVATIEESTFDNLFVCTLVEGAPPVVTALRYGVAAR
jgi:2,3-bisphosphoglycerate-dependent phosphoglycerate mutase